ncbi:MAG: SCO family protein [Thiogranum sp.]
MKMHIIPMLLAAVLISACGQPQPPQLKQATLLQPAKTITGFQLTDHEGKPFTHANLKGKWSFAFFGYTHCPDVCPTALSMLARVMRKLEKDNSLEELPQAVFFSVDPERDTPGLLKKFVPYFHPDFIGVTGDPQQLRQLTRQIGIMYGKAPGGDKNNYLVDHSASIFLFDPDGDFLALFGTPHDPDLIAQGFITIKNYYEASR